MQRRAEFRPFSWLNDLYKREQLDLDPPYQRRSVWPARYKEDFITTVLLNYPCPAIFLFEEIRPDGTFVYKVVDGKQRLTTLFDFVNNQILVSDDYPAVALRGVDFASLPDEVKLTIWRYSFAVEFVPQENESIINDIFNRINKNVARLTPQELRHAKFSGLFIASCEKLADYLEKALPANFPNIIPQSRRQMKDVENIATILLFIEQGEKSMSQLDLDKAFKDRDQEWLEQDQTEDLFRAVVGHLREVTDGDDGASIAQSRLRNQADFYSLFAALVELRKVSRLPLADTTRSRLISWLGKLKEYERTGAGDRAVVAYIDAARSASNDAGPRRNRINHIKDAILDVKE